MKDQGLMLGELTIRTEFGKDGKIKRTYLLETPKYLPIELMLDDLLPQDVGWEITRPAQEGSKVLRVSRSFPSIESLRSTQTRSDITFERERAKYIYRETFEIGQFQGDASEALSFDEWQTLITDWYNRVSEGQDDPAGVIWEVFSVLLEQISVGTIKVIPLNRVVTLITVEMPGEIIKSETNAHVVLGNQASWLITAKELNEGYVAKATAQGRILSPLGANLPPALITGVIAGIIILGAASVWLARRVKQADGRIRDPYSTGSSNDLYYDYSDDNSWH